MDTIADASPGQDHIPQEVRDTLSGLAFAAGGANVVMQLSRLAVRHGVALSKVDSGRVDRHPLKRLRTTSAFLVIALLGTEEERLAICEEINRAHTAVRSEPTDPMQYNAFDPELQLWAAACLYKGAEDIYSPVSRHSGPGHPRQGLLPALQAPGDDAAGAPPSRGPARARDRSSCRALQHG